MEMDFRNRAQLIGTVWSEVSFEQANGSKRGSFEMSTFCKANENIKNRDIHRVIAGEHLALTLRMVGQGDLIAIEGRLTYDKESRALATKVDGPDHRHQRIQREIAAGNTDKLAIALDRYGSADHELIGD